MKTEPRQYNVEAIYRCNACDWTEPARVTVEEGTAALWADVTCSRCDSDDLEWTVDDTD